MTRQQPAHPSRAPHGVATREMVGLMVDIARTLTAKDRVIIAEGSDLGRYF